MKGWRRGSPSRLVFGSVSSFDFGLAFGRAWRPSGPKMNSPPCPNFDIMTPRLFLGRGAFSVAARDFAASMRKGQSLMKLTTPVVAMLVFASASVAYAADATGKIKSIDTVKDMVTLDDGSSYVAPSAVKLSEFKVGEKVDVTFTTSAGKKEMSAMKPAT
jgi:Cu/Ag efflux protein CusF